MPPVPPQKEYPKYVDSLWCIYIVSVVAAWNAEFLTYPLDLIKTRLQIQGEVANKNGNNKLGKAPYRGMVQTAIGISKEEGLHKLWQGLHAAFARHLVYSGTRIITYKALKEKIFKQKPGDNNFPLWQSAVCGVSAGAFAQYIASPTDLLKVQLQMEGKRRLMGLPPRVTGMHDAFKKVWETGGIRGLWKGSVPNVQRAALVNLGDLTTYDMAKRFIMKQTGLPDNHLLHILSSSCAGFVAASMGTPADVIKTRVMNQPFDEKGRGLLYKSSIDCLQQTVRQEGFNALYKGFLPIWMRMAPWSLSFWLTYEEVLSLMGARSW
ncbi:mitochondrial uncoupling protein 4 isoform X3 [Aethina tumida]|nr:mitochondrial uncoupling protein 4 isoform X3 [Aethina tumida]XP_049818986.1 mitochondrial uncoupling protein 4 isoform X3 [Aethina tumida]XP_049818990.1 mitochondrial uncoupling protein 4 isoform X3 [Aethina tumida]